MVQLLSKNFLRGKGIPLAAFGCSLLMQYTIYGQSVIWGSVTDKNDRQLANASIALVKEKDSTLVKGSISSKEGHFYFEKISSGNYFIVSSFSGYKPVYTALTVSPNNELIEVPVIKLYDRETALNNVTVTARKPLFEQKIDRLVINVAANITSSGSTALDVLERSPGVVVDRQNNALAVNGKNGIVIMINGKISHIPIAGLMQMLSDMNSDNIEKIEIITTPPASLDAEGNAGYINIVLKSNKQYGTNGSYSLTGGYRRHEIIEASGNFNHRKKKINLYGDYSFSRVNTPQEFFFYHAITSGGNFIEDYSESLRKPIQRAHNATVGLDYELGKKTIIGGLVSIYDRKWTMDATNNGSVYTNRQLDTLLNIFNHELHTLSNYTANLNIQHDYGDGQKLSANFDYIYYRDNNPNSYSNTYSKADNSFIYNQQVKSSKLTPIRFWIGSFDYSKALSKKTIMEGGLKGTLSRFNNNVEIDKMVQNAWTKDPQLSNNYELNENISAAYISLNYLHSDKLSFKAGLRYEYTNSNLGAQTEKNIVDKHYGNLFPSFFFTYKIDDNNVANFSYSRRITRPTFNDMAPFVIFIDPNTYFSGNPALQPSITDAVSTSYTFQKKIISLSYSYDANPITNYSPKIDPQTNIATLAAENQKNRKTLSVSFSLPFDVTKWWNMQNNIQGYSQHLNGFYNNQPILLTNKSFSINSSQTFRLPKDISVSLSGFYYSSALFGIYTSEPFGSLDVGLQKKWAKSSLRFNAGNILNSLTFKPSVNLPQKNLVTIARLQFEYPNFRLTYSRNFGKTGIKQNRERTIGAEEEKSRVKRD